MKMKALGFVAVMLMLTGCANQNYSDKSPNDIAHLISAVRSDYSTSDIFLAPPITNSYDFNSKYIARLAAVKFKTNGQITDTVAISFNYFSNQWAFFKSITLKGPIELHTEIGNRNVDYCSSSGLCDHTETISAEIPRTILQNASKTGLTMRVGSSGGYIDVELPANYIQGYLIGVSSI